MKFTSLVFVLLAGVLAAQSEEEPARRSELERAHRALVEQRYARAAWPLGVARAGLPTAIELTGFLSEVPVAEDGLLVRTVRFAATGTAAFVLESRVADDAPGAQETLVDWLAGVQSAARMPSASEAGLPVGEAGFVGRSGARPGALAWVAFVRGNVAVRVVAHDAAATPTLELGAVARALDRAIQDTPALARGARPARPALERFETAARAVAGEVLPLTLTGVEQGTQLQWRVGGSGQGYVERDRDGVWRLHTTGPGALTVVLDVIGSLGTVAQRTLELEVADD